MCFWKARVYAKQNIFYFVTGFISVILPGIDLSPDSTEDLRDLIKDSSLVDWKHKFKFILFSSILELVLHSHIFKHISLCCWIRTRGISDSQTLLSSLVCVWFYIHRVDWFYFFKNNFFPAWKYSPFFHLLINIDKLDSWFIKL